jgi:hypothetical protein
MQPQIGAAMIELAVNDLVLLPAPGGLLDECWVNCCPGHLLPRA